MFSVRQNSVGAVTGIIREWEQQASKAAVLVRKRKREDKLKKAAASLLKRTGAENAAKETKLIQAVEELQLRLLACDGVKGPQVAILKEQFKGRIFRGYKYENKAAIGMEYRKKMKRLLL